MEAYACACRATSVLNGMCGVPERELIPVPNEMRKYLEQRVRDLEQRLEELLGFVLAIALGPPGSVSDDLRRRAKELTDLFDEGTPLSVVKADNDEVGRDGIAGEELPSSLAEETKKI
jgi:hypothetical protein